MQVGVRSLWFTSVGTGRGNSSRLRVKWTLNLMPAWTSHHPPLMQLNLSLFMVGLAVPQDRGWWRHTVQLHKWPENLFGPSVIQFCNSNLSVLFNFKLCMPLGNIRQLIEVIKPSEELPSSQLPKASVMKC